MSEAIFLEFGRRKAVFAEQQHLNQNETIMKLRFTIRSLKMVMR